MLKIEQQEFPLDFDPGDLSRDEILERGTVLRPSDKTLLPAELLAPYGNIALLPRERLLALLHLCRGENPHQVMGAFDGLITNYLIKALFKLNPNGHESDQLHLYRQELNAIQSVHHIRRRPLEMGFFANQRDGHNSRSFIVGIQCFGDQQGAASRLTDTSFFMVTESNAAILNDVASTIDGPAGLMPGPDGTQVPYYAPPVAEPGTVRWGQGHASTLRGSERLDQLAFNDLERIWAGTKYQNPPTAGFAFYTIHAGGELTVVHDSPSTS